MTILLNIGITLQLHEFMNNETNVFVQNNFPVQGIIARLQL